jgi:hypothetical protein
MSGTHNSTIERTETANGAVPPLTLWRWPHDTAPCVARKDTLTTCVCRPRLNELFSTKANR